MEIDIKFLIYLFNENQSSNAARFINRMARRTMPLYINQPLTAMRLTTIHRGDFYSTSFVFKRIY